MSLLHKIIKITEWTVSAFIATPIICMVHNCNAIKIKWDKCFQLKCGALFCNERMESLFYRMQWTTCGVPKIENKAHQLVPPGKGSCHISDSCRNIITATSVQSHVSSCGIYGEQSGIRVCTLRVLQCPCQFSYYQQTHLSFIHYQGIVSPHLKDINK
jgi:hypothetical protein